MATTQTNDIPLEILDAYSNEILFESLPVLKWMEYATIREDLERHSGEFVKFIKRNTLRGSTRLTEGVPLVAAKLSSSEISIQVSEFGFAVGYSRKAAEFANWDQMDLTVQSLTDNFSVDGPEKLLQEVALATPIGAGLAIAGNQPAPSTMFANGRANRAELVAGDVLTTDDIRKAALELSVARTPKFNNSFYVCFIHARQASAIKQDPAWIAADNGQIGGLQYTGAVGRWEDVVFIETTTMPNGLDYVGSGFIDDGEVTSGTANGKNHLSNLESDRSTPSSVTDPVSGDPLQTDVYQTIVFGEDYLGFASAVPVEVRDNGIIDHGRVRELSWYAIYGADRIHPERGVVLESGPEA